MHIYHSKDSRIMKKKVNTTPAKELSSVPMTEPKEMEIYELSDK